MGFFSRSRVGLGRAGSGLSFSSRGSREGTGLGWRSRSCLRDFLRDVVVVVFFLVLVVGIGAAPLDLPPLAVVGVVRARGLYVVAARIGRAGSFGGGEGSCCQPSPPLYTEGLYWLGGGAFAVFVVVVLLKVVLGRRVDSPVLLLILSSLFFLLERELPVRATVGPGSGVVVVVGEGGRLDRLRAMGIVPALKVLIVFWSAADGMIPRLLRVRERVLDCLLRADLTVRVCPKMVLLAGAGLGGRGEAGGCRF